MRDAERLEVAARPSASLLHASTSPKRPKNNKIKRAELSKVYIAAAKINK